MKPIVKPMEHYTALINIIYTSGPPPRDPVTTPGYSYDEPRVTLPVRPPTTSPPALYGAPRAQRRLRNN